MYVKIRLIEPHHATGRATLKFSYMVQNSNV
jgi:hypothetical protein